MAINYYEFPQITLDEDGTAWARSNDGEIICEVFELSADDTEEELAGNGFAKCDAPDWSETMVVEETAWQAWEERKAQA